MPGQGEADARNGGRATPDLGRGLGWLGLAGACLLGVGVRLLTVPGLTGEGLRLVSMDDYGHLRRAVATLRNFPHVPVFDPYLNHPEGGIWIWPPLFDFLIALPARVLFGSQATVDEVTLVAAVTPIVLGVLSLPPLFWFVDRVLGRSQAHLAVYLYAVLPAAVKWSSFGHADQHAGEALMFVLVLAAAAPLLTGDGRLTSSRGRILLLSLALAAAVLTWQGAIFLAPILAVAAVLAGRCRVTGVALAVAAGLIFLAVPRDPGPITYVSFGLFQPLFLLFVAALVLVASVPRWGIPFAGVGALVGILLWPPVANGLRHLLSRTAGAAAESGGYLTYPGEWLRLIAEYQPLFRGGAGAAVVQLSAGLVLVPLFIGVWAFRAWRRPVARPALVLLAVATLAVALMALSQKRYVYYLAVVVAVVLAAAVVEIGRRINWPVALALLALALAPTLKELWALPRTQAAAGSDVFATLAALATTDPPAADAFRPHLVVPGEVAGVLAPWSLGHLVVLLAQRPTVADTFGYGFRRQSEVFTAPPELDSEVAARLVDWKCRYLVTTDLRPVLPLYAQAVDRKDIPVDTMLAVRVHESEEAAPLPFLQLVLVSKTGWLTRGGRFVPRLKIYRVAPG